MSDNRGSIVLSNTSLHCHLRHGTAAAHHQIEQLAPLAQLLRPNLSLAQYTDTLLSFAQFYHGLEPHLHSAFAHYAKVAEPEEGGINGDTTGFLTGCSGTHPYQYHARSPLLAADISELCLRLNGYSPKLASISIQLPKLTSRWQLLGSCYVLEGAGQGGKIISKRIAAKFSDVTPITHYFRFYERQPCSWQAWQHWAAERQPTKFEAEQALQAAQATFAALTKVFMQKGLKNE